MRKSQVGIILGVLALILVTTGCSSLVGGKWAVKVNGESILIKDYETRVAEAQKTYEKLGMKFDTEEGKAALPQIKSQLLARMIEGKLIAQEIKAQKLDPEGAKIKEQEDIIKKNIGDDAKFQDTLKQQGMTEAELKNFLTVYEKVTGDIKEINDTDAKAFFDKNVANYTQPESVTARHILVKTEDEAKAIITQLSAVKDQAAILPMFEQLAKEKSTEPGAKESGGDLGTITKGKMVPEFETAVFAQKVGTFSTAPVKTEFGYHVIFAETHTPEVAPDFEKLKDRVKEDALNTAKDTKFQTYFDDLQKKAKTEYAKGYEPAS
ncbi:peptidylprolyl isomerase [Desulfosporosinus fructosivorans]|uniref:peptidylprolyl isomerase n=1 Tax=Desulfosporosinus fructosivorans TaxID=2018669 RepID=A0A4Z0R159_9FIRM|nr:peptidylprolyl isomerase [Desulfosporosinus fructosivorans]TGE36480.1 peptidylprolyl isomerase [Desulfosporosinus fructosivorans]